MFKAKNTEKTAGEPVIRASICTGERVIGFRLDGRLTKEEIVKTEDDILRFCKKYEINREDIKTIY